MPHLLSTYYLQITIPDTSIYDSKSCKLSNSDRNCVDEKTEAQGGLTFHFAHHHKARKGGSWMLNPGHVTPELYS